MPAPERRELSAIELKSEKLREERLARMLDLEDQILQRAQGVVEAHMSFHEVRPEQEEPPPSWVAEYGRDGAEQRLAVAKAGWLPKSQQPSGVDLAVRAMVGIQRARGRQAAVTNNQLNVKIELPAPTSAEHGAHPYAVKEIE